MPSQRRFPPSHDYELLPRSSVDIPSPSDLDDKPTSPSWVARLAGAVPFGVKHISNYSTYTHYITPRRKKRSILRLIYWSLFSIPYILLLLVLFVSVFFPSYTTLPPRYEELRQLALSSNQTGRANVFKEKVFIAASIYEENGSLTSGEWAESVLDLVDLLGPENVHLSLYENDPDALTRQSLLEFERRVTCNSTITAETLDLGELPRVTLPNGETRIKRIAFLADVRNKALAPIDEAGVVFDRVLFLNDVNFNPIDAAQLLFSTNVDTSGRANYGAVCAVDFINAFKFYDRFATRDLDGFNPGIPFYPWFTSAGTGTSRNDVLSGSDAVRVRSCWGGMIAFEAKWFQDQQRLRPNTTQDLSPAPTTISTDTSPLRFRYETDIFWDSSECCLINADLQYRRTGQGMPFESGIFMNPYIRVAYDPKTLAWLSVTRRPELLYSRIHDILNHWVGFPQYNERQLENPGDVVQDRVWEYDDPKHAFQKNATDDTLSGHYRDRRNFPASIICVDLVVRQFPGKKHFKIEDSNVFLSGGLSLSFGVMIFSALYSMLPSAKDYLQKGGLGPKIATLVLVGCFLAGALGIAVLSRILHGYIPHSVVDCDHDHGDEEEGKDVDGEHDHSHLERPMEEHSHVHAHGHSHDDAEDSYGTLPSGLARRPSLHAQISTKVSRLVTGSKEFCDEDGQCFGYSDPCGQECFRNVQQARIPRSNTTNSITTKPSLRGLRSYTTPHERQPLLQDVDEETPLIAPASISNPTSPTATTNGHHSAASKPTVHKKPSTASLASSHHTTTSTHSHTKQHHHHVPTNVFLSIGLQTSIAIALHKIPEGFITYATNHANPRLGVSIFLALFIHNITEGFAMALPLYLAISSRWKAIAVSALLGGVSQPLGAGVAALWFNLAGRRDGDSDSGNAGEPGDVVYGCMFAVTAGIMAMVSLQLLGESLDLTHSRKLCFASAFLGMGILGLSSALTA
ncbi:glycosyltransferase family 69 protein [Aaosphaeria arxii CBS 175.79]|uniref:Glycosyltransferase family 69 protein n=1 Tax=Aaosphaeria arxii CBS 175.79 TaxID=1450172 RepID=A0A6A5XQU5_9PLEO|nr:glycosyltransferase family 69 protein [Aaosphaeria arxii CBS 175.79]KAF2015266.1 glycosyltransferase family 69 protein [Aaosphaeria arxii CBS 175.79]